MSSQTQGADSDRLTGLCDLTQCILDAMPYPVFVRDRAFRVVLSNRAADDYFQRSVIGLHCFEVRGGRAQPCDDCPARTAAHTGKPISREVRDPKSGEELNIDSYPIFDAAGEFVGLVEAFQVITRRKRTERKISELLAKLTRRNRELADRQQVMDSELELAREIQRRLLPGRAFEMGAFKCSFFYRPTGAVGGDIYDIRALDSERTALIMADAIGHGVPAALIAAMIHALFHSSSYDPFSPVDALERLNSQLRSLLLPGHFVTAVYVVFDGAAASVIYGRAGHPYPVLLPAESEDPVWLTEGGTVLGGVSSPGIAGGSVRFSPGDRLVLYTDGLVEAMNRSGEPYGKNRLKRDIMQLGSIAGGELPRAVMRKLKEFTDGRQFGDDVTLGVAEYLPRQVVAGPPVSD